MLLDLTCQQRASYRLAICSEDGIEFATPTLAPTHTAFPLPAVPAITNTPIASPTVSNTPTPSNTPYLSEQVPIIQELQSLLDNTLYPSLTKMQSIVG